MHHWSAIASLHAASPLFSAIRTHMHQEMLQSKSLFVIASNSRIRCHLVAGQSLFATHHRRKRRGLPLSSDVSIYWTRKTPSGSDWQTYCGGFPQRKEDKSLLRPTKPSSEGTGMQSMHREHVKCRELIRNYVIQRTSSDAHFREKPNHKSKWDLKLSWIVWSFIYCVHHRNSGFSPKCLKPAKYHDNRFTDVVPHKKQNSCTTTRADKLVIVRIKLSSFSFSNDERIAWWVPLP